MLDILVYNVGNGVPKHCACATPQIIRTALVALEGELQQEQAALQASTQEQQSLVAQVEGLQARLAEAPQ